MVARSAYPQTETDHFHSDIHCTSIKVETILRQVSSIPLQS